MKVVDHDTFVAMPAGTLYAYWDPYVMERLLIKGESISWNDWWEHDLLATDLAEVDLDDGKTVRLHPDVEGRDALYNSTRRFVVFDNEDVELLIEKLKRCLKA